MAKQLIPGSRDFVERNLAIPLYGGLTPEAQEAMRQMYFGMAMRTIARQLFITDAFIQLAGREGQIRKLAVGIQARSGTANRNYRKVRTDRIYWSPPKATTIADVAGYTEFVSLDLIFRLSLTLRAILANKYSGELALYKEECAPSIRLCLASLDNRPRITPAFRHVEPSRINEIRKACGFEDPTAFGRAIFHGLPDFVGCPVGAIPVYMETGYETTESGSGGGKIKGHYKYTERFAQTYITGLNRIITDAGNPIPLKHVDDIFVVNERGGPRSGLQTKGLPRAIGNLC